MTGMKKNAAKNSKRTDPKKKSRTGPAIVAQLLKNTIVVNNCVIIFWAEEKPNISNKNNAFLNLKIDLIY